MDSFSTIPNQTAINEEDEHFSYAMQLVTSASLPMVLFSAFRPDVFEIIAKAGPDAQLSASQIAANISSKNPDAPSLRVQEKGLFQEFMDWHRSPSTLCATLMEHHSGVCLRCCKIRYELEDAVREGGIPFNRVRGTHAFEYPGKDPRFNEVLQQGNDQSHNYCDK